MDATHVAVWSLAAVAVVQAVVGAVAAARRDRLQEDLVQKFATLADSVAMARVAVAARRGWSPAPAVAPPPASTGPHPVEEGAQPSAEWSEEWGRDVRGGSE